MKDNLVNELGDLVNDCISRRAAADIVRFECGEWEGLAKTITKRFEALPPAQPTDRNGQERTGTDRNGLNQQTGGVGCHKKTGKTCADRSTFERNI